MKIKEIREYLLKYPQLAQYKNKIKIEDMKSQNRYYFFHHKNQERRSAPLPTLWLYSFSRSLQKQNHSLH